MTDKEQVISGICNKCWSKLVDFHSFYRNVEIAHHRVLKFFKKEMSMNHSSEKEIFHISLPQILKTELLTSEETFGEDELLSSTGTAITCVEKDTYMSTEKRKRGRPRQKCNMNEAPNKKPKGKRGRPCKINKVKMPKGKRGRPRKINNIKIAKGKRGRPRKCILDMCETNLHFQNDLKGDLKNQPVYTHEPEASDQTALGKAIRRSSPIKIKRNRGRPRKIQINIETSKSSITLKDFVIPCNDVIMDTQSPAVHVEAEVKDEALDLNEHKEIVHKKPKIISLMKKRNRVHQRKALMRNYIATSMRCMKFIKK